MRLLCTLFVLGFAAPAFADEPTKTDDGYVSLFNGKDLKGWKTHPDDKAKWEVKDGAIVGTGPAGHLYSERGDFTNFHYRIEAMINDKGNSGQYFRTIFAKGFPPGYECQINSTHGDPVKTGSLYKTRDAKGKQTHPGVAIKEILVKPDNWFVQEVIADGNHIIIMVNGKKTVDCHDEAKTFMKGHFAIQQHDPGTVIKIKRIEVKELPATK